MSSAIDELLDHVDTLARERIQLMARIKLIDADISVLQRAAEIIFPGSGHGNGAIAGTGKRRASIESIPNLTQAMLETLREAPRPLTAAEVGALTLERLGHSPDLWNRSALTSRATTALAKYAKRGTLLRLDDGSGLRWAVAR